MRPTKASGSRLWRRGESQAVQLAEAGGKLQAQSRADGHEALSSHSRWQARSTSGSKSVSLEQDACFTTEVGIFPSPPGTPGASRGGSRRAFHGGARRGTCAPRSWLCHATRHLTPELPTQARLFKKKQNKTGFSLKSCKCLRKQSISKPAIA